MTKDEIDASGAPHSGIRSTSPPSKEVAPSAVELLQLADQQAYMRARYNEEDSGLIRESQVIEWALRQAATPAVGMREALELARKRIEYLGQIGRSRHAEANERDFFPPIDLALATLQFVQPPAGEGVREAPESCPHCFDRSDCSNVDICNAVEEVYRPPSLVDREALAQWLENEAAQYGDSDTIVYSPRNVANILATQAARLRSSALSSTTAERGAGLTVSDEDWARALDCAYSCLVAPAISKAELDNAMQHAFGLLVLRALSSATAGREADAWEWRACIGGRWGAWLYLDQPLARFKERNTFNLENGTYELRPLYALSVSHP